MFTHKDNFYYRSTDVKMVVAVASAMLAAGARVGEDRFYTDDYGREIMEIRGYVNRQQKRRLNAAIQHLEWAVQ